MSKPECRIGTYRTNGAKIEELRLKCEFSSEEAFCGATPAISKPTLQRAESSGCIFKSTLEKLAQKLNVPSWKDLLSDPQHIEPELSFVDPVKRQLLIDRPFTTFDETTHGAEILDKIELLIQRKIPFVVMAFNPGSVEMLLTLEKADAIEIDALFAAGELASLHIIAFRPFTPPGITGAIKVVRDRLTFQRTTPPDPNRPPPNQAESPNQAGSPSDRSNETNAPKPLPKPLPPSGE